MTDKPKQDFITEAKYNKLHQEIQRKDGSIICQLYFHKDFTDSQDERTTFGHFIAAAINEKIERDAIAPSVGETLDVEIREKMMDAICKEEIDYASKTSRLTSKMAAAESCAKIAVEYLMRQSNISPAPSVVTDEEIEREAYNYSIRGSFGMEYVERQKQFIEFGKWMRSRLTGNT